MQHPMTRIGPPILQQQPAHAKFLDIEGLAAKRLEERMLGCLARREGPDGQWYVNMQNMLYMCSMYNIPIYVLHIHDSFRGKHECLAPGTPYLAGVFNYLRLHKPIPLKVRAIDMRHILLLLP